MPIVAFENRRTDTLKLVIEPAGDTHDVPHLATAGIRYFLEEGVDDRSTTLIGEDRIEFWCNAACVEVDVVHPSPFEKLLWDICVNLGFCGGIVAGTPTHVGDLIPSEGFLSAEAFADLALTAEGGWTNVDEAWTRWGKTLEAKFVEHLGAAVVPVEVLKELQRAPFDIQHLG
jgi:hypothetical protein